MTEQEIINVYRQVEGLSTPEIESLIRGEYLKNEAMFQSISLIGSCGALIGTLAGVGVVEKTMIAVALGTSMGSIGTLAVYYARRRYKKNKYVSDIRATCNETWNHYKTEISDIIKQNPKTSRSIMDIILLLAPAIAQQYAGFTAMAIVGTLTIMCKQNLGL